MNITEVLSAGSFDGLNTAQEQGKNQLSNLNAFDLLFNLLMNCCTEGQPDKTGQTAEELGQSKNILTENSRTNSSLEDEGILEQNSYHQILQNLFPTGMEADYGIRAEKKPIDIFFPALNINGDGKDFISAVKTLGKIDLDQIQPQILKANYATDVPDNQVSPELRPLIERVNQGSFSPEQRIYVQAQELAQNRQVLNQLQELSGKIEAVAELNEKSPEKTLRSIYNQFNILFEQILNSKASAQNYNTQIYNIQKEEFPLNAELNSIDYKSADTGNTGNAEHDMIMQQDIAQDTRVGLSYSDKTTAAANMRSTAEVSTVGVRVAEQVFDAIRKQDLNPAKEVRELSIQLHPAELGKVNISLKMENGLLNVVINTSEQNTGLLLQNNMQDLKNELTQIGVACGSFEMNYQPDGQAEPDTRPYEIFTQREAYKEDYDSAFSEEELYSKVNSYTSYNGLSNRINFRA